MARAVRPLAEGLRDWGAGVALLVHELVFGPPQGFSEKSVKRNRVSNLEKQGNGPITIDSW